MTGFFSSPHLQDMAAKSDHKALRTAYRDAYLQQLAAHGHTFSATKPIQHLYELVFASKSRTGLEFWEKACRIAPDGQRELL